MTPEERTARVLSLYQPMTGDLNEDIGPLVENAITTAAAEERGAIIAECMRREADYKREALDCSPRDPAGGEFLSAAQEARDIAAWIRKRGKVRHEPAGAETTNGESK